MGRILLIFWIFLIFFSSPIRVFAQEINIDYPQGASPSSEKVEYTLPYPGILPDNPLYFFKAARDRIVSLLINDPLKRAEFNLLTSDKRVYAASVLVKRGKLELAVSTLSKSNNYLDESLNSIKKAKKANQDVGSILNNLHLAILKHKEVVLDMEKKVDKKFLERFHAEEKRLDGYGNSVNALLPK